MNFIEDQVTYDRLLMEVSESSGTISVVELLRRGAEESDMDTAQRVLDGMLLENSVAITLGRVHFTSPPEAQQSR